MFAQYPLAPTSMAKKSTDQPFVAMTFTKDEYFVVLVECQLSIFSSHGHVSSISITLLWQLENIITSGLNEVIAI